MNTLTLERRVALTVAWKPNPRRLDLTGARQWTATVDAVHDGDTITADVDLGIHVDRKDQQVGFRIFVVNRRLHFIDAVRLYGLNAAELATAQGVRARAALIGEMPVGSQITLTTWLDRNDKYGRVLGAIQFGQVDINQWLIDNGWAAAWGGHGPKPVPD